MYARATKDCECVGLPTSPINNRVYWMDGYIYKTDDKGVNESVKECSCHKKWRLNTRCEFFLKSHGLPSIETIKSHKYVGQKSIDSFKKVMLLGKIDSKKLAKSIVYMQGPTMTQKTSTALMLILVAYQNQKTVEYQTMEDLFNLIQKSTSLNEDEDASAKLDEIFSSDILIVDNAFQQENIGSNLNKMKLSVSKFSQLVQSRDGLTIFISQEPIESIPKLGLLSDSFYNYLLSKTIEGQSNLKFEDRVDITTLRSEIKNGGLWS